MTLQDCSQFEPGTDDYQRCKNAESMIFSYSHGGGNPWGDEALALVNQFFSSIGLDRETKIPDGQMPDANKLVGIINELRDIGELNTALQLNNMLTNLLANGKVGNTTSAFKESLYARSKILNGLGLADEARFTRNIADTVAQLPDLSRNSASTLDL